MVTTAQSDATTSSAPGGAETTEPGRIREGDGTDDGDEAISVSGSASSATSAADGDASNPTVQVGSSSSSSSLPTGSAISQSSAIDTGGSSTTPTIAVEAESESSSTTSTRPTVTVGASGVAPGSVAGGVIGAFAGGVLLALLAAFLFARRRRRGPKKHTRRSTVQPTLAPPWEKYLPQPADDEAAKIAVKSLLDQVALHVDNFYGRKAATVSGSGLDAIVKVDSDLLRKPLPELLQDQSTQLPAIKHCIAHAVMTRIMPGKDANDKFIPLHLARVPRKVMPDSENEKEAPAASQAYSKWKALTSYLLPDLGDDPILVAHRRKVAMGVIQDVSAAFGQWEMAPSEGPSATEHLARVIDAARNVGTMLASQPSSFQLEWRVPRRRDGGSESPGFVLLPGLTKVSDELGRPLTRPQYLLEPVIYPSRGSVKGRERA